MAVREKTIDKYHTALTVLRHQLRHGEPIIGRNFAKEWSVSTNIFSMLADHGWLDTSTPTKPVWIGPVPTPDNIVPMIEKANAQIKRNLDGERPATRDELQAQIDQLNDRITHMEQALGMETAA